MENKGLIWTATTNWKAIAESYGIIFTLELRSYEIWKKVFND